MSARIERLSADSVRVQSDEFPDTELSIRGTNEAIGRVLIRVLEGLETGVAPTRSTANGRLKTGPWSKSETALLGTDKDRVIGEKLHRATANVTAKRLYEEAKAAEAKKVAARAAAKKAKSKAVVA